MIGGQGAGRIGARGVACQCERLTTTAAPVDLPLAARSAWFGHPILALAPGDSAITEVLNMVGDRAETCTPDDPEAIAAALLRLIARRRNGYAELGGSNGDGPLTQFTRREQVSRIAKLLSTRP